MLDYIHRSKALALWSKLAKGEEVSLEAALGAYDMFILHDNVGDSQEVSFPLYNTTLVRCLTEKLA